MITFINRGKLYCTINALFPEGTHHSIFAGVTAGVMTSIRRKKKTRVTVSW